eukprot:scaffold633_cov134-Isochrysis_galbana.AAC.10
MLRADAHIAGSFSSVPPASCSPTGGMRCAPRQRGSPCGRAGSSMTNELQSPTRSRGTSSICAVASERSSANSVCPAHPFGACAGGPRSEFRAGQTCTPTERRAGREASS